MADAALREDVLRALRQYGVTVEALDEASTFRLSKGLIVEAQRFQETVSRKSVNRLSRVFEVPMAAFFPPLS